MLARPLDGAEFEVIPAMVARMPAQPFMDEWAILDQPGQSVLTRYKALSTIEQVVPLVFLGLHGVLRDGPDPDPADLHR